MINPEEKRKENVIEYVLYLFHTEDILRSLSLNLITVEEVLIEPENLKPEEKIALKNRYESMIEEMERLNLENSGHIEEVYQIIGELSYLHNTLLTKLNDKTYEKLWNEALPFLKELESKANETAKNPIELCFNGLYGVMVLKMKKQKVSDPTVAAMQTLSNLLKYLGKTYKEVLEGKLSLK